MRKYELTYLVSDEASEIELTKVTGKVDRLISGLGGKIIKEESWGRRKLAYPINKINFATYVTVYFEIDPEKLNHFKKDLGHTTHVLRHLIMLKDYDKEEITLTREDVAENEEIAEVVGGEKSTEIATEKEVDSRDLMAKRDKEDSKGEETKRPNTDEKETKELTEENKEVDKAEEKKVVEEKKKKPTRKTAKKEVKKIEKEEEDKDKKTKDAEKSEKEAGEKTEEKKKPAKKTASRKKTAPKKTTPEKSNAEDEAERLSKLDEELDELLKDDI